MRITTTKKELKKMILNESFNNKQLNRLDSQELVLSMADAEIQNAAINIINSYESLDNNDSIVETKYIKELEKALQHKLKDMQQYK